jgi:hypothetical protein
VLVRLGLGFILLRCGCGRTVASLAVVYAAGEGKHLTEVVHLTGDTRSVICWKESCEPVNFGKTSAIGRTSAQA